jgi:ADP-heptose:LPS heptosyltransferase
VLLATRPGQFVAFATQALPETVRFPAWIGEEHEVLRWCRLLWAFGIPCDPSDLDLLPPLSSTPPAARGATLLHPGAARPARRWPEERWAEVARREVAAGRAVAITAGPGEDAAARRVAHLAGLAGSVVLSDLNLDELAAAVHAAARVVSTDTGIAHLATALRRPSTVIFGPTSPDLWGPPSRPQHRVIWAGKVGDPNRQDPDPGLLEVTVDDVEAAIR